MDCDYKIKTIIIGDCGVGKSCILTKFIDDEFIPKHNSTIGVDLKTFRTNYLSKNFKLFIWDTAGQERFKAITRTYYKGVDAIIICFDLTNVCSFNNVILWFEEINKEKLVNPVVILVGTKSDLVKSRVITKEEALDLSKLLNCHAYWETSAKNNTGINDIFSDIVKIYCSLNNIESSNNIELSNKKVNLQVNPDSKSSNIKLDDQSIQSKIFKIFSYFICY
jgi:small GTP-binding protein